MFVGWYSNDSCISYLLDSLDLLISFFILFYLILFYFMLFYYLYLFAGTQMILAYHIYWIL